MAIITFSENHNGQLIGFEEGVALSSFRDPQAEGLKWAYSLGHLPSSKVVVLGLGSGYHIAALADIYPNVEITVVESRVSLVSFFRTHFPDLQDRIRIIITEQGSDIMKSDLYQEVLRFHHFIVSFRECWGKETHLFAEFFSHLTGRSVESLNYHLVEFGIDVKAFGAHSSKLLSINDVLPMVKNSNADEKKKQIFRIMGELVK